MKQFFKGRDSGQAALLLILTLFTLFVMTHSLIVSKVSQVTTLNQKYSNKFKIRALGRSSFSLLEAALERRLWEPPPDGRCLKAENFSVSGTSPDGLDFTVEAEYDSAIDLLIMRSTVVFGDQRGVYEKLLKLRDASEFLIFDKSQGNTTIARQNIVTEPVSWIGRDRKIYLEGQVIFDAYVDRGPNPADWFVPSVPRLPAELGTIVQGERIIVMGGFKYRTLGSSVVNDDLASPFLDPSWPELEPWLNQLGGQQWWVQNGAGSAVITGDFTEATTLAAAVQADSMAGVNYSEVKKRIYPRVLSSGTGTFPIEAELAPDNGTYINDLTQTRVFLYNDFVNGGHRRDLTCLEDRALVPNNTRQQCSSSDSFPNGYAAWKNDAGLNTVLFQDEVPIIESSPVSWDSFDAMKEDALACGLHLTSSSGLPTYTDCDMTDSVLRQNYRLNGTSPCKVIRRLNLEPLALTNFNEADYANPLLEGRYLRRVVYTDMPLEIEQTQEAGLWTTLNPQTRENLSIWFVNSEQFTIKPNSPVAESTSPIDPIPAVANPSFQRGIYFNGNNTLPAAGMSSLKLLFVTPEPMMVISPQHQPYSFQEILDAYPVSDANKFQPNTSIFTDTLHQEADAFFFGTRRIRIFETAFLMSQNVGGGRDIYLRGLWRNNDSSADKFTRGACIMADPLAVNGRDPIAAYQLNQPPEAHVNATPLLPSTVPLSLYYNPVGGGSIPFNWGPHVFRVQQLAGAGGLDNVASDLNLTGVKYFVPFDSATPLDRRDLSQPKYIHSHMTGQVDFGTRKILWNGNFWYALQPAPGVDCSNANLVLLDGAIRTYVDRLYFGHGVNPGNAPFSHSAPSVDFRKIGYIGAKLFSANIYLETLNP